MQFVPPSKVQPGEDSRALINELVVVGLLLSPLSYSLKTTPRPHHSPSPRMRKVGDERSAMRLIILATTESLDRCYSEHIEKKDTSHESARG